MQSNGSATVATEAADCTDALVHALVVSTDVYRVAVIGTGRPTGSPHAKSRFRRHALSANDQQRQETQEVADVHNGRRNGRGREVIVIEKTLLITRIGEVNRWSGQSDRWRILFIACALRSVISLYVACQGLNHWCFVEMNDPKCVCIYL